MKTIKEWLEELPEPYRTQALENVSIGLSTKKCKSLIDAIMRAFTWVDTPQGYYYWYYYWSDLRYELQNEGK